MYNLGVRSVASGNLHEVQNENTEGDGNLYDVSRQTAEEWNN
jgi:hypothetical protein